LTWSCAKTANRDQRSREFERIATAENSQVSAFSAHREFSPESIQGDEPRGPIESQVARAGRSGAVIARIRVDSSSRRYGLCTGDSRRRHDWLLWIGLALLALIVTGGWIGLGSPARPDAGAEAFWKVGRPAAIAVHDGRASFRVPTPAAGSEVLVVVSALARARGPFPIQLTARAASGPAVPLTAEDGPRRAPRRHAALPPEAQVSAPACGVPPVERVFHMMVRDGDSGSPSNYAAIRALLKGLGRRVQVYIAAEDIEQVSRSLVQDLITTFDDRIFPLMTRCVGRASDVDGDGRFTILLSSWLDHLGGGRHPVDGFVRVADLDPVYRAPFGNHCDMMYLSTALKAGPHLRTVLAHEYMHAVVFSQKTLRGPKDGRPGLEEEGWLDEAMAHLVEDLHGFSTSNIDYRISAFLTSPERYQLVVDDYYAADLFRSHGNRGSTYLFLRWCADRYGADLLSNLVHSNSRGAASLEDATGSTFAELYRRWSLALFASGLDPETETAGADGDGFRSINMRAPCEEWELIGPRFTRVSPAGPADSWSAVGTSSHFAVVESSPSGAVEITVTGPLAAELQVTAVPLEPDLPKLDLALSKIQGPGGESRVRMRIKERNGTAVRLSALSWEPLTPRANPHSASFRCGRLDMLGIAAAFGTSALPAAGELGSRPIVLRGVSARDAPVVVKLIGTDQKGRRIAAWADLCADGLRHAVDP
jgi:hypothetical protein